MITAYVKKNLNTCTYLEPMKAYVKWPDQQNAQRNGFSGLVTISQRDADSPARYKVRLWGLEPNTLHGFHIHEKPVTSQADLEKTCQTCGGHFNPTGVYHGSVLNTEPEQRHVGDLINNVWADEHGEIVVDFYDNMATLIHCEQRPYSILGRSLVVHEGEDDLGRQGRYQSPPYLSGKEPSLYWDPNKFVPYPDHKSRLASFKTGNAGKRLACGNIQQYPKEAWT